MEKNKEPNAGNPMDASTITRKYYDSILVEERLIGSTPADIKTELFGEEFNSPIMMPSFSHLNHWMKEQDNAMIAYTKSAKELGAVNWVGMCENEEFKAYAEVYNRTIRVIKPYADENKVYSQIKCAKECGALAVGMDIDHIFGNDGEYDDVFGEKMTCQTVEKLKKYVEATKLPFIIKGVLSVRDALLCAECGVKGILISHHHSRMPFAIPPAMVLPRIKKALKEYPDMTVMVDCGIDSGVDAFKALALGADAVAVGRVLIPHLMHRGTEGVSEYVQKMNMELRTMMNYTGCSNVKAMDLSVLWINGKPVSEYYK